MLIKYRDLPKLLVTGQLRAGMRLSMPWWFDERPANDILAGDGLRLEQARAIEASDRYSRVEWVLIEDERLRN